MPSSATLSNFDSNIVLETTLAQIADRIIALKLELPALLFLQLHLPLTTLAHTACLLCAPIASPLFGFERIKAVEELLSDRKNIERLIELIEKQNKGEG